MKFYNNITDIEVGVDEVGRGCLFGPVVAASCILPQNFDNIDFDIPKIADSKKLSKKQRELAYDFLKYFCIDYSVAFIDNDIVDKVNIYNATMNAMHNSLDNLKLDMDMILIDGKTFKFYINKKGQLVPYYCIVSGDNKYYSIAAASILAKVTRDRYIEDLCQKYPLLNEQYKLLSNKGYGTKQHLDGIKKYGITNFHRKTFGICKKFIKSIKEIT